MAYWSGMSVSRNDLEKLFIRYSNNFIKMRYPFECYKNMNENEYIKYGKLWIELGAPLEEAEYQYCHKELNFLNTALLEEVECYLANQ